jgi:gluconokinase
VVIVIMGVAGAGKTTVGRRLAETIHADFVDADDFHPPANIEKMSHGLALSDDDRGPWLDALSRAIDEWLRTGRRVVLACSALKAKYRVALRRDPQRVLFVYLKVSPEVARERVARRAAHFMRGDLVENQFDTLEEPGGAIVVDGSQTPEDIIRRLLPLLPADR